MDLTDRTAYGGGIWDKISRVVSFDQERAQGDNWRPVGYNTEYAPLREVVLRMPGEEIANISDPDHVQFLEKPDLDALRDEIEDLAAIYRSEGIIVHFVDLPTDKPNLLYMRELFLATRGLTFIGRPATTIRAGEERYVAEKLAQLGVPLHAMTSGTFEAADIVYIRPDCVLFRYGNRSQAQAMDEILRNTAGQISLVNAYEVPADKTQHLLGLVNIIDRDLVLIKGFTPRPIIEDLQREVDQLVFFEESEEVTYRQAANAVTLGPRKILMPDDCPQTKRFYQQLGIEVLETKAVELRKGAGGLACATGILTRDLI